MGKVNLVDASFQDCRVGGCCQLWEAQTATGGAQAVGSGKEGGEGVLRTARKC